MYGGYTGPLGLHSAFVSLAHLRFQRGAKTTAPLDCDLLTSYAGHGRYAARSGVMAQDCRPVSTLRLACPHITLHLVPFSVDPQGS